MEKQQNSSSNNEENLLTTQNNNEEINENKRKDDEGLKVNETEEKKVKLTSNNNCKGSNCSFYGSEQNEGYCSVCYKKYVLKQEVKQNTTTAPETYYDDYELIERRRENKSPLIDAVVEGNLETVKKLILEEKKDVNEEHFILGDEDLGPYTPLGYACFFGHTEIVKFLVGQPGIDVNKEMYGNTYPINSCCQNHRFETAKALINECNKLNISIDLNKKGYLNATPIEMCCYEASCGGNDKEKFLDLIIFLVQQGADLSISSDHKRVMNILEEALNKDF
ncbi:hypothetical protein ABK040_015413 [Willaertia magna]